MPMKKGGGDKDQPYSEANGEYIRNEQCLNDEKNLVLIKLYNMSTGEPIAFPKKGVHDETYCTLFVKYCLNTREISIPQEKVTKYLLIPREKDDKSKFLNNIGYNINNWQKLYSEIVEGTNFKNISRIRLTQYTLNFATETTLLDLNKYKMVSVTTIWKVNKDLSLSFVSLLPKEYKDDGFKRI